MFKRILVAYDGSEGARAALRMGIGLAKSPGTELYSISVEEHLPRYAATIGEVEDATSSRARVPRRAPGSCGCSWARGRARGRGMPRTAPGP